MEKKKKPIVGQATTTSEIDFLTKSVHIIVQGPDEFAAQFEERINQIIEPFPYAMVTTSASSTGRMTACINFNHQIQTMMELMGSMLKQNVRTND